MFTVGHFVGISVSIFISCCDASFLEKVCKKPMDVGKLCGNSKSNEKVKMYFFDTQKERCSLFYYLGCAGNKNKFTSSDDCIDSCQTPYFIKKNENEDELILKTEEIRQISDCQLKPEAGPCRALITMWYFNTTECFVFGYGGCQGNLNKFDTQAECESFCNSKGNAVKT